MRSGLSSGRNSSTSNLVEGISYVWGSSCRKVGSFRKLAKERRAKRLLNSPARGGSRLRVEPLEDRRLLSMSPWFFAMPWGARSTSSSHSSTPPITVALRDRPSTSDFGQSVQLTSRVTGATTGSVEFFDGTTEIGQPVSLSGNGVAAYVTSSLAVGTHSITAEYFATGATTATSTSTAVPETVNATPTSISIAASNNPLVAGGNVTFTATVTSFGFWGNSSSTSTPAGSVVFTVTNEAGGTPITGTVTVDASGKATFTPSTPLAAGTYDVTAVFTPSNSDYEASSSRVVVEQILDPSAVGVGTVTAGTATSPITLRGGEQLSIGVAQALSSDTLSDLVPASRTLTAPAASASPTPHRPR